MIFHKMESKKSFFVLRFKFNHGDRLFKKSFQTLTLRGSEPFKLCTEFLEHKAQEMFNLSLLNLVETYLNRNYRMIIVYALCKLNQLFPAQQINRKQVV